MKRALFVTLAAMVGLAACKQAGEAPKPATGGTNAPAPAAPAGSGADPWSQPAAKKDPLPHPLFWKIEKDGNTTYAIGTMHTGVDAATRMPDIVWDKLDAAKSFAMETDISDPSLMKSLECDHCSLKRDLGDAYYQKLEAAVTPQLANGIENKKPMVAALVLSMQGLPQTAPMDTLFLARAQRHHTPVIYLEPAQVQAALLEKWMDIKALKALLDDVKGNEQHIREMLAAYVAGDEKQMLALSDTEKTEALAHGYTAAEYDQEMQDMLYGRNASWIPEIEKMHAAGGGFIAVGAMHLVGPNSVLELLGKRGYTVTRVEP